MTSTQPATKFLFVRHAQTVWNSEHRYAGDSEVPLAPEAIGQIAVVSQYLAKENIDAIYSSPLGRCVTTITPTAEHHRLRIIIRDDLKERNLGEWEGKTPEEIETTHGTHHFPLSAYNGEFHVPHAEPLQDLEDRLRAFMREMRESHPGQTIAVATHAGVIWALETHIVLNNRDDAVWSSNCSVTTVMSDQNHFLVLNKVTLDEMSVSPEVIG